MLPLDLKIEDAREAIAAFAQDAAWLPDVVRANLTGDLEPAIESLYALVKSDQCPANEREAVVTLLGQLAFLSVTHWLNTNAARIHAIYNFVRFELGAVEDPEEVRGVDPDIRIGFEIV